MKRLFRTSIVSVGLALLAVPAFADPPVDPPDPTDDPIPPVFCFRITDVEQVIGDANAFNFEFEVLNWTATPAAGLTMMRTVGATVTAGVAPFISSTGIDPDGRGGPVGDSDIGPGVADMPEMQSGRGNHAFLNDWAAGPMSPTAAAWTGAGGTPIPNRDLLGVAPLGGVLPSDLVPTALGPLDGTGDTAIDGGVGTASVAFGPEVIGSGNVLDGFILTIDDFDIGERVAFNWFLLDDMGLPIGVAGLGNAFGFGTLQLLRGPGDMGPMFVGNSGFGTGQVDFFDNVGVVPAPSLGIAMAATIGPAADDPAVFFAEFGAGITAPFGNPGDNTVDVPINTSLVSEPAALATMGLAGLAVFGLARRSSSRG